MGKDRALYIGPSHAAGGIPVVMDGTKPVEVEGLEYKICGDAYRSPEKLDFKQKTNIEVLDSIHDDFSCRFDQNKASGTDFIICKLAVRDLTKHDRYGTVREILDQMQGEVGCKLSDGTLPEPKLKRGGLLHGGIYNHRPLHGYIKWKTWDQFVSDYPLMTGIYKGKLNPRRGNSFEICQDFSEIESVIMGNADLFDLSKVNYVKPHETVAVIAKAITIPGNSVDDLIELSAIVDAAPKAGEAPWLSYEALKKIPTILEAAKMLGYDAILVNEAENYATLLFVWNLNKIAPIIIWDAHNMQLCAKSSNYVHKYDKGGDMGSEEKKDDNAYISEQIEVLKQSLTFLDGEDAKEVNRHIKLLTKQLNGENGGSSYAARVAQNLAQMGSSAEEWRAVPIIGFHTIEIKGKKMEMPIFSFPEGYENAPSLYKNTGGTEGTPTCELCGKAPIGVFYWIQDDPKRWTMGVGSECIRHFQAESGKEMQRAQKVEEAKQFDALLRKLCLWILAFGYKKHKEDYLASPKQLGRNITEWKLLFQDQANPMVKNYSGRFFILYLYKELYPFEYEKLLTYEMTRPTQRFDEELKKWVIAGPADPKTAKAEAEKQLLSWYSRKKEKYITLFMRIDELFKKQGEYAAKEFPNDYRICNWATKEGQTLRAEFEQILEPLSISFELTEKP